MVSFISTFITVGICLAIYAYIKRKYSKEIEQLERQIADLNLNLVRANTRVREMDNNLFLKEKEVSNYKIKLETMVDINKGLTGSKSITVEPTKIEALKKRGRKPGTKRPYNRKKSGGNPS